MTGPQVAYLPDGRLHLHHGPIDLIVSADGPGRQAGYAAAVARFDGLLEGLVADLGLLRQPILKRPVEPLPPSGAVGRVSPLLPHQSGTKDRHAFGETASGPRPHPGPGAAHALCNEPTATRMMRAIAPYTTFVTPMAAVAGAVADEILAAMIPHRLTKATVNNGGDIAFHLADGETFRAISPAGNIRIAASDPARGVATSGWRGRSHSLGIADAVTVVAKSAAEADVAATLIANAVDLPGHPAITRLPAQDLNPESDLGQRPVTTHVGKLSDAEILEALGQGARFARACLDKGLILAATLTLASETHHVTQTRKTLTHA